MYISLRDAAFYKPLKLRCKLVKSWHDENQPHLVENCLHRSVMQIRLQSSFHLTKSKLQFCEDLIFR